MQSRAQEGDCHTWLPSSLCVYHVIRPFTSTIFIPITILTTTLNRTAFIAHSFWMLYCTSLIHLYFYTITSVILENWNLQGLSSPYSNTHIHFSPLSLPWSSLSQPWDLSHPSNPVPIPMPIFTSLSLFLHLWAHSLNYGTYHHPSNPVPIPMSIFTSFPLPLNYKIYPHPSR